eukprot:scaffold258291_cov32-Tisochrysis_lutea.AAC.1
MHSLTLCSWHTWDTSTYAASEYSWRWRSTSVRVTRPSKRPASETTGKRPTLPSSKISSSSSRGVSCVT